ncbi:serine/threonine protein kinase [Micromonospora sp. BRA006-A]|nr:serine/threonine protein kinase [Micromonospora sp. BRA006-A]
MLATHDPTGTPVAIKYLIRDLGEDSAFRTAFRTEARLLGEIDDPHVSRLYEYVESPHGAAIVMELVDGVSLRQSCANTARPHPRPHLRPQGLTRRPGRRARPRCRAPRLQTGERAGRRHRVEQIADFGIAMPIGQGSDTTVSGTPRYMAPEQWTGAPASPACDVYAATATFFECLTGRPPYQGPDLLSCATSTPARRSSPRRHPAGARTAAPRHGQTPRRASAVRRGVPGPAGTGRRHRLRPERRNAGCASRPGGHRCWPRCGRSRTGPRAPPPSRTPNSARPPPAGPDGSCKGRARTALAAGALVAAVLAGAPATATPPTTTRPPRDRPARRALLPPPPAYPYLDPTGTATPSPSPTPSPSAVSAAPPPPAPSATPDPTGTPARTGTPTPSASRTTSPPPPDVTAPVVDGVSADPGELDPKGCPYGAKSSTVTATVTDDRSGPAALTVTLGYTVDGATGTIRMAAAGRGCSPARSACCPRPSAAPASPSGSPPPTPPATRPPRRHRCT